MLPLQLNENKDTDQSRADLEAGEDDEDTDLSSERKALFLRNKSDKDKSSLFSDLIAEILEVHAWFTAERDKRLVDLVDQRLSQRKSSAAALYRAILCL